MFTFYTYLSLHTGVCSADRDVQNKFLTSTYPYKPPLLLTHRCIFSYVIILYPGRDIVAGVVTVCGLDGPGIESLRDGVFSTGPDLSYCPPSFLYNACCVSFLGVKQQGLGIEHPPPSRAEVEERLQLRLHYPLVLHSLLQGEIYISFIYVQK